MTRYQASAVLQGKAKALALGPYLVLDRLGSGGMGLVFQARRRDSRDVVALKILPPSASKQEQAVLRFRREAKIMAQLAHANLVASREIGEHNGVHYLVMDYVEGLDLHRIVRSEGPLGVRRAVDCVIQAARGLSAAHERGIVHRDIKPANLMVEPGGTVRVLDLGLARITQAADPLHVREPDPSLTYSGMMLGTVDFVSPEQSNNPKLADHRSDIYSLGCTLHFLLTGRPPYSGETIMERLIAHHQQPAPSLLSTRSDVPLALDTLFHRMMDKDPNRRPQSMNEVIQALEVTLAQGEVPASEQWESLATGWVAANPALLPWATCPGYEVLNEAPIRTSCLPCWIPRRRRSPDRVDRIRKEKAISPSTGSLEPSGKRRRIGLVLLVLLAIGVVSILISFVRWIFAANP